MTVGEKIVETRKAKGITQKQLAEMAGIPLQTLVRYEKGGNIPVGNTEKIANALETTPSSLLGWEKQPLTSNEEILSSFTTQELAEEIAKRCGE